MRSDETNTPVLPQVRAHCSSARVVEGKFLRGATVSLALNFLFFALLPTVYIVLLCIGLAPVLAWYGRILWGLGTCACAFLTDKLFTHRSRV